MDVICGGPVGLGGRGGREVQVSFYVVVQFSAVLLLRTMFHRPLPILTNVILEVEDDFHIFCLSLLLLNYLTICKIGLRTVL